MTKINNTAAAQAIAKALAEGLFHPGDPQTDTRATTMILQQHRPVGPPPYRDGVLLTNRLMSEAIIYLIETHLGNTILPTSELEQLRTERDKLDAENIELRAELDEIGRTL